MNISLSFVKQPVLKEKFEFKPVVIHFKNDFISHPVGGKGVG